MTARALVSKLICASLALIRAVSTAGRGGLEKVGVEVLGTLVSSTVTSFSDISTGAAASDTLPKDS